MTPPSGPQDFIRNIFSPAYPQLIGIEAEQANQQGNFVVDNPGLVDDDSYEVNPSSPVVDEAGEDTLKAWIDFDGKDVPRGGNPGVGAFEVCE